MDVRPTIGPGDGRSLFEELERWDFWSEDSGQPAILDCDFECLREAADALWMASPFRWRRVDDRFSFLASSSIRGGADPCADLPCRVDRAQALGRFAALYSDVILIRDPFEPILYGDDSPRARLDFANMLITLEVLRPEIEAGVIAFAPMDFAFCKEHAEEFKRVKDGWNDEVWSAGEVILEQVLEQVTVELREKPEYRYVSIGNTASYVPHDGLDMVPIDKKLRREGTGELGQDEARGYVHQALIEPALVDLSYRYALNWMYDVRYLTDRQIDADLLDLLGGGDDGGAESSVGRRIQHGLPFVDGLDVETLLKLRKEEGEAFRVYRDRVRSLFEAHCDTDREFQEAFRDIVEPELNRIDNAVATAKKMVKSELREKLVFGTGVVTMGLAAGTITPSAAAVVSALGGAKLSADLWTSLKRLLSEPRAARENDFYFLWKARDLSGDDS